MEADQYLCLARLEASYWYFRSLRRLALSAIGPARRVLDAGSGTGGMLAELSGRVAVGVELSPLAVSLAREKFGGPLVRGSVCALPFASGAFDAVLSLDVLYHAGVGSDEAAVAEFLRVLRPGGVVAAHAPALPALAGPHDRAVHGVRRYTRESFGRLFSGAGFAVERLFYRNLAVLPAAAASRLLVPGAVGSELKPLPRWLNGLLYAVSRAENSVFFRLGPPFGLSVFCLARRLR